MNFLLTNDDGIRAPGLRAAAHALAALGKVRVVAPSQNYSGYGAALPPVQALVFHTYAGRDLDLPGGAAAFAVAGPPAACVQVGLSGALGGRPVDCVISGINDGLNTGRDIFYSGTVGAAITAHLLGVPALAVSLDGGPGGILHWESAAWAIGEILRDAQISRAAPMLFNINVPNLPLDEIRGLQMTALGRALCLNKYRIAVHTENILCVEPREERALPLPEPGTDTWVVQHGFVSITPLRLFPDLVSLAPWEVAAHVLPIADGQPLAAAA